MRLDKVVKKAAEAKKKCDEAALRGKDAEEELNEAQEKICEEKKEPSQSAFYLKQAETFGL